MSESETLLFTLLLLCVPVGLLLLFGYILWSQVFRGATKRQTAEADARAEDARRRSHGFLRDAKVILASPRGDRELMDAGDFGRYRDVDLTLEVSAPDGAPYRVRVVWEVQTLALPKVAPEQRVTVAIDPRDPEAVSPSAEWARTRPAL